MNPRRQIKRSKLFVLRIWSQEADTLEPDEDVGWQGHVKRAVDGEAQHFDGLQGLLDWLTDDLRGNSTTKIDKFDSEPLAEHQETDRRTK